MVMLVMNSSASYVMPSAKTFPQTNMNRQELQEQLIVKTIDGMDINTMWQVLYDFMDQSYDKYTNEELTTEVKEYYPELLEEN